MPNLKLIEQLNEHIESTKRDVKIYGEMLEGKKQILIAFEERVEKLSKQIDEDYGENK